MCNWHNGIFKKQKSVFKLFKVSNYVLNCLSFKKKTFHFIGLQNM